ncbi:Tol-Pal system beta propeller repeat protein TolB [Prosthecomicrobium sp. N25]
MLATTGIAAGLSVAPTPASAQLRITITPGQPFSPMPIAVPIFSGDSQLGAEVARIVAADLKTSGYFAPVDPAGHIDKVVGAGEMPNFNNWRPLNIQALIAGTVTDQGGQVTAQVRVWDVATGQQLVGQQFATSRDNVRRLAHIVADAAYSQLTGFKGMFDSRVVFVDESGPKNNRVKRLAIMDWDGQGVRYLTRGQELVLTPRFSPSAQQIAYMAYGQGDPKVFLLNVANGARQLVGDFPSMTFSPRFSPDGGRLVLSLQKDGDANVYVMDLGSRQVRALTQGASIDTSPSFSPDGGQIVFESDRGGSQQLYVMGADGSNVRRISFGSGRYSTPVWSPDPDNSYIAFTKQEGGSFKIGVMKPDGSGERTLTEGYHNEGPTWSPNGRYVMFFRESGGPSGGPGLWLADVTGNVLSQIRTPAFASDPAWSPLLR